MTKRKWWFAAILGAVFATQAHAFSNRYECVVVGEARVSPTGQLKSTAESINIGEEFVVDRQSGRILGDWLFDNSGNWNMSVLNRGSESDAFKVVSTSRAGLTSFLSVLEYEQSQVKPFIYLIGDTVLTGTCD